MSDLDLLEIVNENDEVVGQALRREIHGDPTRIHRVAHVLVLNPRGELYLQKRSFLKDVQPGKWDTSVGGHLDPGEDYHSGALREMEEELGIRAVSVKFLYKYLHMNDYETEFVSTFSCLWEGKIRTCRQEIEEGRYWSFAEIEAAPPGLFTPNFLDELRRYREWTLKED